MNPSDTNSALATLRQLKEMLDAGTLTPQEFEALKQKLVFGPEAATPPPAVAPERAVPPPSPVVVPVATPAPEPVANPSYYEPAPAAVPYAVTASEPVVEEDNTPADLPDETTPSGPLNLVFAIGGVLVLLAVVLYLTLGGRARDEHVTSTSQTAADSTATVPEVGPQTAQLDRSSTAPETVRVAPAVPRPTAPAATSTMDSAVAAPTASAPAKATPTPSPPAKTAPAAAISVTPSATAADSAAKAGQP